MAYSPATNYSSAPPDPFGGDLNNYQSAQKAYYADQAIGEKMVGGLSAPSGIGGTAAGLGGVPYQGTAKLSKSLQDEAAQARNQSDQLKTLICQLHYAIFEPVQTNASTGTGLEKDNPSTIEGSLQHTTRNLAGVILSLENILSKIGGR